MNTTSVDLCLRRDRFHDARLIPDGESSVPGILRLPLDERL
jgi:hypothetical protein